MTLAHLDAVFSVLVLPLVTVAALALWHVEARLTALALGVLVLLNYAGILARNLG